MKFYNYSRWTKIENIMNSLETPCIVLLSDNWNDFGYQTYYLSHFIKEDKTIIELGGVKILDRDSKCTSIKDKFTELENQYCSLGVSMDYYEKLGTLGKSIYEPILLGLKDAAYDEKIKESFINLEGFQDSLLREVSSRNALNNAKAMLEKLKLENSYNFSYKTQIEGADEPHEVKFNFGNRNPLPSRVTAIVGKNGTGKTAVLSDLAFDLSEEYKVAQEKFSPKKPELGKLITISYSVFGGFEKKKQNKEDDITYQNFGVLDEKNTYNKDQMLKNLEKSIDRILEFERTEIWIEILSEFNNKEFVNFIHQQIVMKHDFSLLGKLSSGQRMIFEIITNIVGNIRNNSLIIFDEPEIHLHPNAIGLLMKALYFVLEKYESFAIIATHVPQVIQQIPAKSVIVFEREDNIPIIRELPIESFGEDLTSITNEIFETMNVFDNYKIVLKKLYESMTYDEIIALFKNKLPLNAKIYLKSLE